MTDEAQSPAVSHAMHIHLVMMMLDVSLGE